MCKARAELFKQYLSSDHVKWDPQEKQTKVDICEESERIRNEGSLVIGEVTEGGGKEIDKSPDGVADPNVAVDDSTLN